MRVILGHECADLEVKIGHLSCCRLFDATKTVKLSGPRLGWLLWHLTALLFDSFEAENVVL